MKTLRACAGVLAVLLAIAGIGIVGGMSSAAALGGPDSISGTATDDAGNPVAGVEVGVYYMQEELIGSVATGADGTYSVDGLTPGEYYDVRFGFNDPYLYADQAIKSVQVVDGAGAVADVLVHVGGQVTGTVRGLDSDPVDHVDVTAYAADDFGWAGHATTDANGTYSLRGLPVGSYRLKFAAPTRYRTEWYNDKTSVESADNVVATGGETATADVGLTEGTYATGLVTRHDGSPYAGVYVEILRYVQTDDGLAAEPFDATRTDADGRYTTRALDPGQYQISAAPRDGTYPSTSSEDFFVTENREVVVRDIRLNLGGIANTEAPVISGGWLVGDTLTATTGQWNVEDATYAFQWLRDGQPINGATEEIYALVEADANHEVQVQVTASKEGYRDSSAYSTSRTVLYGSLPNSQPPVVTGVPKVGEVLRADPGVWYADEATFEYRWMVEGEWWGATGATYELTPADYGQAISVEVIATTEPWLPGSAVSAQTDAVAAGDLVIQPSIAGDLRIGSTLTASVDAPAGADVRYSWRVRSPAAGSSSDTFKEVGTASSFTLADRYKNYALRLVVTVSATGYNDAAATVDISEQLR